MLRAGAIRIKDAFWFLSQLPVGAVVEQPGEGGYVYGRPEAGQGVACRPRPELHSYRSDCGAASSPGCSVSRRSTVLTLVLLSNLY